MAIREHLKILSAILLTWKPSQINKRVITSSIYWLLLNLTKVVYEFIVYALRRKYDQNYRGISRKMRLKGGFRKLNFNQLPKPFNVLNDSIYIAVDWIAFTIQSTYLFIPPLTFKSTQ